jgi:peptide methionine sulfoxide reductase msrA/msrB
VSCKKPFSLVGCFWCTEATFNSEYGVVLAISGFYGGYSTNVSYENHGDQRESVLVYFNNASTSYKKLLVNYWTHIDPTQDNGQFADTGDSYKTAVYYFSDEQKQLSEESKKILEDSKKFGAKKIAVDILNGQGFTFHPAEEYHQNYSDKNPRRYEYYKAGSGRTAFIKENWYGDKTFENFLKINMNNNSNNNWHNFTNKMKVEKIKSLTDLQVKVTQKEGTEPPFKNEYDQNYEPGIYVDILSGEPLYSSKDKFDSGTGWPSFVKSITEDMIATKTDYYLFYPRVEVRSKIADSHLGHVFDDGPADRGGKRYCMNSAAMKFVPLADMEKEGYGEYIKFVK